MHRRACLVLVKKRRLIDHWQSMGLLSAILYFQCLMPIYADELKPFTSDGCSVFPDGTLSERTLWLSCCTAHDYAYWQGGTYGRRREADETLKQCVAEVGQAGIALLMLAGVRVGGTPLLPTQFRWGYGWSYPRWYGVLSEEELIEVAAEK